MVYNGGGCGANLSYHVVEPVMQSATNVVFENERISIAQYRCWPDSKLWHNENQVGERAELAFPRLAVSIWQERKHNSVASPNEVVLYDAHTKYTRQSIDPRGDLCEILAFKPAMMEEIACSVGLPTTKSASRLFRHATAPCTSRHFFWQRSLFLYLVKNRTPDPVFVEEAAITIAKNVLLEAANFYSQRNERSQKHTSRRNRELANAAAEFVSRNHQNPISLEEIASNCGCSVFHLCHVFRANRGISVYQYLLKFRLRSAVSEIRGKHERKVALNRIASDYCFASHSHFSSAFFKQFGLNPSRFREIEFDSLLSELKEL